MRNQVESYKSRGMSDGIGLCYHYLPVGRRHYRSYSPSKMIAEESKNRIEIKKSQWYITL